MQLPAFIHKKSILIALAVLLLLLYAGVNVWLYQQAKNKSLGSSTRQQITNTSNKTSNTSQENASQPQEPTSAPIPPTPSPRLIGSGRYACDPNGICGDYGDEQRKSCPVTFADRYCLDSCGDKAKWCTQ